MSSYDPSQWYSYSKNRPNDPPAKIIVDKRTKIIEEPVKSMPLSSPSVSEHVVEAEGKNPRGQEVAAASHSHSTKMNSFVKRLQKMARELPRSNAISICNSCSVYIFSSISGQLFSFEQVTTSYSQGLFVQQ